MPALARVPLESRVSVESWSPIWVLGKFISGTTIAGGAGNLDSLGGCSTVGGTICSLAWRGGTPFDSGAWSWPPLPSPPGGGLAPGGRGDGITATHHEPVPP